MPDRKGMKAEPEHYDMKITDEDGFVIGEWVISDDPAEDDATVDFSYPFTRTFEKDELAVCINDAIAARRKVKVGESR